MENLGKSRWEGNEHWFKYDHHAGLKRFDEISTLGNTATAVALRTVKYQLENELGLEITDNLFCEIFKKVCDLRPVPACILNVIWALSHSVQGSAQDVIFGVK